MCPGGIFFLVLPQARLGREGSHVCLLSTTSGAIDPPCRGTRLLLRPPRTSLCGQARLQMLAKQNFHHMLVEEKTASIILLSSPEVILESFRTSPLCHLNLQRLQPTPFFLLLFSSFLYFFFEYSYTINFCPLFSLLYLDIFGVSRIVRILSVYHHTHTIPISRRLYSRRPPFWNHTHRLASNSLLIFPFVVGRCRLGGTRGSCGILPPFACFFVFGRNEESDKGDKNHHEQTTCIRFAPLGSGSTTTRCSTAAPAPRRKNQPGLVGLLRLGHGHPARGPDLEPRQPGVAGQPAPDLHLHHAAAHGRVPGAALLHAGRRHAAGGC